MIKIFLKIKMADPIRCMGSLLRHSLISSLDSEIKIKQSLPMILAVVDNTKRAERSWSTGDFPTGKNNQYPESFLTKKNLGFGTYLKVCSDLTGIIPLSLKIIQFFGI
jgi:hypothetical protein